MNNLFPKTLLAMYEVTTMVVLAYLRTWHVPACLAYGQQHALPVAAQHYQIGELCQVEVLTLFKVQNSHRMYAQWSLHA